MHDDDLLIPAFLRRDPSEITTLPKVAGRRRERRIPYPKDGYLMKGKRAKARELHREHLRRRDAKKRQR